MKERTVVQDLFEASYLLCRGHELKEMEVEDGRRKPTVHFIFDGTQAKDESRRFKMGQATANVCMLKVSMNHLKDLLFQRLRDSENPEKGEHRHARTRQA